MHGLWFIEERQTIASWSFWLKAGADGGVVNPVLGARVFHSQELMSVKNQER